MQNWAVLGLGFGDEGKGLVTDYLARHHHDNAVTRFSGGHQCGHTVVDRGRDLRHVFASFGSGTLRGLPTYVTADCIMHPGSLLSELKTLKRKGVDPRIYIHEDCVVTTPFDILCNRRAELISADGSCGVGIGATMQREYDFYNLSYGDLWYPDVLKEKIRNIQSYYGGCYDVAVAKELLDEFMLDCAEVCNTPGIKRHTDWGYSWGPQIFEGSQGLMLDQHYGFFPNVTRANTGTANIPDVVTQGVVRYCLVTRAYQTRHGKGYMTNTEIPHGIAEDPQETNQSHPFQGEFRRSLLDLDLLRYAIGKDPVLRRSVPKYLVITCLDHIEDDYRFTAGGKVIECRDRDTFVDSIAGALKINSVLLSSSPDSADMETWRGTRG